MKIEDFKKILIDVMFDKKYQKTITDTEYELGLEYNLSEEKLYLAMELACEKAIEEYQKQKDLNAFKLTYYKDRNGRIGDVKDIEDSPMYDGRYHREFEDQMQFQEKLKKLKWKKKKKETGK